MSDLIPLILIDGRPVRRARFVKSLEIAEDLVVVATVPCLEAFSETHKKSPAAVVVVDGAFTDTGYYATFVAEAERLGCPIVPIWDYPTSGAEKTHSDILENKFGQVEDNGPDPRLLLLLETLREAARRKNGRAGNSATTQGAATLAAIATPVIHRTTVKPALPNAPLSNRDQVVIGIGASTGGVQALSKVLATLDASCPPVLIVQHMPPEFVGGFADRLDRKCQPHVRVAQDGDNLVPGLVLIAPGDHRHMRLAPGSPPRIRLTPGGPIAGHVPSVDALFSSLAPLGALARCALLTGMGADGAEGMLAVHNSGGMTVAQDEATCTVFGMPKEAIDLGAASATLPLERIGPWLMSPQRLAKTA